MKIIKDILLFIFNRMYPILKPPAIQKILRSVGFKFPYLRFAEKLDYRGVVDFKVNDTTLYLQSYNKFIEIYIFWYGIFGVWEPTQLRLWSTLIKKNDIVLDIGANSGVYSLIASTNLQAKVFAFEPVPAVLDILKKNIALNNVTNITVVPSIVSDFVGEETIYIPWQGWVDVASIDKQFAEKFVREEGMQELKCPATTVDAFLSTLDSNATTSILCKIDVEGAEDKVLKGMQHAMIHRNISFTAELLTQDFFDKVKQTLPEEYAIFAIDEGVKKVYKTNVFVITASNYYIVKSMCDEIILA